MRARRWQLVGLVVVVGGGVLVWAAARRRASPRPGRPTAARSEPAWVSPRQEACPVSHPVKAKLASGIFHEPSGVSYRRTIPDRCYRDGDAARVDGLRPAKR